jgi:RimJ/RimL family protein N-acetyltransferase
MHKIFYKNKFILIRKFDISDISKSFLKSLNNKKLNRFLSTRKKKQTKNDALSYFNRINKKEDMYLAVIDRGKKNQLVGTITYRKYKINDLYIGFMVCDENYLGNDFFYKAVKASIKFMFKSFKLKKIFAGTNKENISSSFFLLKLGFQLKEKKDKTFKFVLKKKYG